MSLREGSTTHATVLQSYEHAVAGGRIARDPAQAAVAAALDRLTSEITAKRLAHKSSALGWLFGRKRDAQTPVKGLYIHGGVGRGKTMLMDMFFDALPIRRKRRVHFNAFMNDVHDRIARHRDARRAGETDEDDPIPPVARALAEEAWVLCFDEFSVTDIADAMILSRLFSALFEAGLVLVATSNVAPDDLYRDGLNRGLFEPFIDLLKRHAVIARLDGARDYRLEKLKQMPVYLTPLGEAAERGMAEAWAAATKGRAVQPASVSVSGRQVVVPQAAGDVARFGFADLCEEALGARDYLALASRFSTIFVDRIPVLTADKRNEAKRLILLVDTLYDRHVRLVVSAAAPPEGLYQGVSGTESFEFARTASRLAEMQSREWQEGSDEQRRMSGAA